MGVSIFGIRTSLLYPARTYAGYGEYGQLGNGSTAFYRTSTPSAVAVPKEVTAGWSAVSTGLYHTCAIEASSSRSVYCFGRC